MTPTPAGETLARHARNLVRLLSHMEAEMSEYADGARGHVRIVANTSAVTQFLPDDLSKFKAQFPDVRIALSEQTSEIAVQEVSKITWLVLRRKVILCPPRARSHAPIRSPSSM